MSKQTGPVCRLCRREGQKLFLKGVRCSSPKCPFERQDDHWRRDFAPGQHGRDSQFKRSRSSDYLLQLREKQKGRRMYGVMEAQFRRYYAEALRSREVTGKRLLQILECRMDNVVYRLGYATSRAQARNLVNHGHFNLNGRRVGVPSAIVQKGDRIEVREGSQKLTYFKNLRSGDEARACPSWLSRDWGALTAEVLRLPEREDIEAVLNEQLIVEYYSR
jgi:small subunit ribosomal protein S4